MELEQLKGVCRLCLERSQHVEPLFDERSALVGKLCVLTQLQIAATDGWPAVVCRMCVEALNAANRFRSKCLESHQKLEAFFSTINSNSIVIKEERLDLETAGSSRVGLVLDLHEPSWNNGSLETTIKDEADSVCDSLETTIKDEADSVCDPPLFVDVGPFEEEVDDKKVEMDIESENIDCVEEEGDNASVAFEVGESSKTGEEQFYCKISDKKFQEAIAVDVKRHRLSRKRQQTSPWGTTSKINRAKQKREAEKLRQLKIKENPDLLKREKLKKRIHYLNRKKKGQVKLVKEMSSEERTIVRDKWRSYSRTYRYRRECRPKLAGVSSDNFPPLGTDHTIDHDPESSCESRA